ncbi:MAG: shikimate kinase [Phormidesmis sp.]
MTAVPPKRPRYEPRPTPAKPEKPSLRKTNLYLIGMMGAGKTTIGKKLANRLSYRFLDTDALIEKTAGQPVSQIFAQSGEAAFRQIESEVLSQTSSYTQLVVATGGGIITQPMNWSYLRHGIVIWLDVPVPVLVSRLSGDTSRPLLQAVDLTEKLETLLHERGDRYAQADIRIPYEGRSVGKTCDRILTAIQKNIREPKRTADEIVINQPSINSPATNPAN